MQVADLFRPPLGVLSVKCPSRANQASGLAGGFDFLIVFTRLVANYTNLRFPNIMKLIAEEGED